MKGKAKKTAGRDWFPLWGIGIYTLYKIIDNAYK
jgi:hypothetical protein